MGDPLADLRPRAIWKHFAEIVEIPRPSKDEGRITAWVRSIAAEHGWEVLSDDVGNLVLRLPATKGREQAPTVVLQTHLDMVCEKNRGVEHDFTRDPIRTRIVDDWVHATGTTLGADNGLGVAAALAVGTAPDLDHGPLELLFTIDEETGLTGARDLDAGMLQGRYLLNLDSEEDGKLFVGCAGGADSHIEIETQRRSVATGAVAYRIEVTGLRGGHSGLNIAENRGNAVKLLNRVLLTLIGDDVDPALASFAGGDKHNAIPREAEATIVVAPPRAKAVEDAVARCREEFRAELEGIDDGVRVEASSVELPESVLSSEDRDRLVRLVGVLPHGVLGMSPDIAGLVETSSNVASIDTGHGVTNIVTSSRGSVTSSREAVLQSIDCAGALAGARVQGDCGYPGWKPRMDSPLLSVVREVYTEIWGSPPEVTAVHAGLECGLLGEKIPGMDMISFGPQIEGAHSPDERVQIPSVERFWNALVRTLEELAKLPA